MPICVQLGCVSMRLDQYLNSKSPIRYTDKSASRGEPRVPDVKTGHNAHTPMNTTLFQHGQTLRACLQRIGRKMAKMTYIPTKGEFFSWSEEASYPHRGKCLLRHTGNTHRGTHTYHRNSPAKVTIYSHRVTIYSDVFVTM
jgi:hypothetical protein